MIQDLLSFVNSSEITEILKNKSAHYSYSGSIHSFRTELFKIMNNPKYNNIYQYILEFKELLPHIRIISLNGIIIKTEQNNNLYFINKKSLKDNKILIFNLSLIDNYIKI